MKRKIIGLLTAVVVLVLMGCPNAPNDLSESPPASMDYTSTNIGTLKYVPAGSFQRDATATNISVVTQPYRMSETEITRIQFLTVMGVDPSSTPDSIGTSDPVQKVNWYHAIAFCNKLSIAESLTPVYSVTGVDFVTLTYGNIPISIDTDWNAAIANWSVDGYRLPTEMEWMWAAMGAISDRSNDYTGAGINTTGYIKGYAGSAEVGLAQLNIGDYAWYFLNSGTTTRPAGSKLPNELGLYDMSGNIWEWNWDWSAGYPTGTIESDTTAGKGAASGTNRVARGGSWNFNESYCSITMVSGSFYPPSGQGAHVGFRVVRP